MPLVEFVAKTMAALQAREPEAYTRRAQERRDAQRTDDIGNTHRFNTALG